MKFHFALLLKNGCRAVSAVFIALLLSALNVFAQGYPNKPIRLIAPFPPGGALDLIARGVAQKVGDATGQSVVVENKAGAAGAIGSEFVARSAPDGYTLLLGATTTHGITPALNPNLPYDAIKDFTPVSLVALIPHMLVVNAAVPATTLTEFVQYAKTKPGIAYGSAGNGSPHHLGAALFASLAGFQGTHVPYKGVGPSLVDLISGQVAFMSVESVGADPHIKSGKIRPLAVAASTRLPGSNVPTFAESGFRGFEVTAWYAVFGPANMPPEVLNKISSEVAKSVDAPDFRERLKQLGATPIGSTSAVLGAHVKSEIERWTRAAKLANFKME
jgi:tripartite-type tricarboxylate transporter receptor subunit TctC